MCYVINIERKRIIKKEAGTNKNILRDAKKNKSKACITEKAARPTLLVDVVLVVIARNSRRFVLEEFGAEQVGVGVAGCRGAFSSKTPVAFRWWFNC